MKLTLCGCHSGPIQALNIKHSTATASSLAWREEREPTLMTSSRTSVNLPICSMCMARLLFSRWRY